MKHLVLAVLLTFTFSARIHAGSQRLIGSWKSNKAATLQYLRTHTKLTAQQLDKLGPILGKMVIVFDAEHITEKSGTWKFTTKYTIVEDTKDTVTIEAQDPETKKLTKSKFILDSTGFWSPDEKVAGYRERFDRVSGN